MFIKLTKSCGTAVYCNSYHIKMFYSEKSVELEHNTVILFQEDDYLFIRETVDEVIDLMSTSECSQVNN